MPDVVHIAPGLLPPELEDAGSAERIFATADRLSLGPLRSFEDPAEWKARRLAFWLSDTGDDVDEHGDFLGDPSALVGARSIVLWLDTSLDDQLTLAWLPAFLRAVGASPDRVDLVQSSLQRPNLEPFAAHLPPQTLSPEDLAELRRVWDALVAPEPDVLAAALRSDYERLPWFKRALRSLFLRYPEKISGVNATELRLLERCREGPVPAARVIGGVLGDLSGPDVCDDQWLFRRILRLGDPSLPEPALELSGSREAYRFVRLRLTPFGARVLAGEANFVDANGIDAWIAGVHLQSAAGRVWYHDQGGLIRRR